MTKMDFLTDAERAQMEVLMAKATERMRKSKGTAFNEAHHFLFLHCQCECRRQMERNKQAKEEFEQDVRTLLNHICSFCHKHRIPMCKKDDSGEEDDELPLPF